MEDFNGEHLLSPLCQTWLKKIDRAKESRSGFDNIAEQCKAFLCQEHTFLWEKGGQFSMIKGNSKKFAPPDFQMTVNKAHEFVSLYGPALYSRNPVRTCTRRKRFQMPQELVIDPMLQGQVEQATAAISIDPMAQQDPAMMGQFAQMQMVLQMQQQQWSMLMAEEARGAAEDNARAQLLELYLNYTPNELDLATHAQKAITEALITGLGVLWCESYEPPGSGRRLIGSFYGSNRELLIDPDAESMDDALWVARRCVEPYWQIEKDRGLPAGSMKKYAKRTSAEAQGDTAADWDEKDRRNRGETNDQIVYWKIWSKMGIGGRMSGMLEEMREPLEMFGQYCYLEVAPGVPFPLNLPSTKINDELTTDEELLEAVAWPIPFWQDDRWPFTPIVFYNNPDSLWPIAPMAPGLGELKFIDWAMSFLATHIRTACRTFIAHARSAAEEIKQGMSDGGDHTFLPVETTHGGIDNVIQFLQHPPLNSDIWTILSAVMEMFDKRVGLTELLYGITTRQMRSAAEAGVKAESVSVRPDYMAGQVEKAMTEAARREAMAIRLIQSGEDVADIVGPHGALLWTKLMAADPEKIFREIDVRVEAGSARRPNRERDTDNMNQVMQVLLPVLDGHATTTGDTNPLNNVIAQWGTVIEKDMSGLMMGPRIPMMPPMVPGQEGPPSEGGEKKQEQGAVA